VPLARRNKLEPFGKHHNSCSLPASPLLLAASLLLLQLWGCGASRPQKKQEKDVIEQCKVASLHPETIQTLRQSNLDPDKIRCNSKVVWAPNLNKYAKGIIKEIEELWSVNPDPALRKKAKYQTLGYLVRNTFELLQTQNLGVMHIKGKTYKDKDGQERPLLLFRSAIIIEPKESGGCFNSLVKNGDVQHVINLYGGTFPLQDKIEEERERSAQLGVSFFDARDQPDLCWRKLVEEEECYLGNLEVAMKRLAAVIQDQILKPGGEAPRGNIYLHCAGGMHRSGIIFGVLRKCFNGDPMDEIEQEYKRHTAYTSDEQPGGYEELNLKFIKDYDCSLLGR